MAVSTENYNLLKPSYDEVADIATINGNMDKIDTQMKRNADGVLSAEGIIARIYDGSGTYAVGDYCVYNDKMYRCVTAVTAAEAFNSAKWVATRCDSEFIRTNAICYIGEPIVFDFVDGVIKFPSSLIMRIGKTMRGVNNNPQITMSSWGWLGFNTVTNKIVNINPTVVEDTTIAIGMYYKNNQNAHVNGCAYTIITNPASDGNTLPDFACFGDSIVSGVGCSLPFMYYLNVRSGVRIHNYGIGGTGYAHTIPNGYSTVIGNGNFTRGSSVNINYANNSILDRVKNFAVTLPQKYILLFGGTNDWASDTPLDTITAAIEECITTLYSAGKVPIIVLPTPRLETVNGNNLTFVDFVNAIKASADKYNAPVIDCYNNMGLYPQNAKNMELYYGDTGGLHPNNSGHVKIGCRILSGLKEICVNTDNIVGA